MSTVESTLNAGESVAGSLSLRVQQLDVRCETKTKDNVGPHCPYTVPVFAPCPKP